MVEVFDWSIIKEIKFPWKESEYPHTDTIGNVEFGGHCVDIEHRLTDAHQYVPANKLMRRRKKMVGFSMGVSGLCAAVAGLMVLYNFELGSWAVLMGFMMIVIGVFMGINGLAKYDAAVREILPIPDGMIPEVKDLLENAMRLAIRIQDFEHEVHAVASAAEALRRSNSPVVYSQIYSVYRDRYTVLQREANQLSPRVRSLHEFFDDLEKLSSMESTLRLSDQDSYATVDVAHIIGVRNLREKLEAQAMELGLPNELFPPQPQALMIAT